MSINPPVTPSQMDFIEQVIRRIINRSSGSIRMNYHPRDYEKPWNEVLDKKTAEVLQKGYFIIKTFKKPKVNSKILSIENVHTRGTIKVRLDLTELDRSNVEEALQALKKSLNSSDYQNLFKTLVNDLGIKPKKKH